MSPCSLTDTLNHMGYSSGCKIHASVLHLPFNSNLLQTYSFCRGGSDNERSQTERPIELATTVPHQATASQAEADCSTHNPNPPTADQNETEHSSYKSDVASLEPVNPAIAHQVFKEQRPRLMIAISSSPLLVNQLYADDVITKSVLNKLTVMGYSKDEKNVILLNAVEEQIEIKPSAFMTFVSALQSEPALEEMACQLLHSYRKFSDTCWYLC